MGTPSRSLSVSAASSLGTGNHSHLLTKLLSHERVLDAGIVTASVFFASALPQLLKAGYSLSLTTLSAACFSLVLIVPLENHLAHEPSTSPLNIRRTEHSLRVSCIACAGAMLTSQWIAPSMPRLQFWLLLAPTFIALTPQSSRLVNVSKRLFDLLLGSLGLVPLIALTPLLALLVKLSSRGPVFFSQIRVGKNGQLFPIYKFRTMYLDAPRYGYSPKGSRDPRVTPTGRALRRSKLDELPQLINVLLGQMSLVGPRPEMPFIVEQYTAIQRQRLALTPGITGLWQISEHRTAPIHEHLEYDFYYAEHRSMILDLAIICRTASCLIGKT